MVKITPAHDFNDFAVGNRHHLSRLDGEIESSDPIPMNDSRLGMTVELYLVKADFVLPVRIATDASAGPHTLKVSVRYQTCSEKICLPPKTKTIEVPATVSR